MTGWIDPAHAPAWALAAWVTLKLAGLTTLIPLLLGTPLAWWLARTRSWLVSARLK